MWVFNRLSTLFVAFCILGSLPCHSRSIEVFHLGTKDHSFKEFLHPELAHGPVVYNVGSSITSRDWPAYQQGSFDLAVTRSTMEEDWIHANKSPRSIAQPAESFQIVFKLLSNPEGSYVLQLDAIFRYRRPAAPK